MDQVGKVDADAGWRLIAAQRLTEAVLAAAQFQQQRIVLVRAPRLGVGRTSRTNNAESRPDQGGQVAQLWAVARHDVSFRLPGVMG
ncbi:hypothetical protein GCM10023306_06440 [Novosphingobium ginsenosidimutans]